MSSPQALSIGTSRRSPSSYTCIVFDARGSGLTRPATCRLTTTSMAHDALEVLRHVGYDSAHVHGLSLGGMVAQELAIRAPHRVRTLVLGATTAGGTAATPARLSTMWSSIYGTHSPVPGSESLSWRGAFQQATGRQHARRRSPVAPGAGTHPRHARRPGPAPPATERRDAHPADPRSAAAPGSSGRSLLPDDDSRDGGQCRTGVDGLAGRRTARASKPKAGTVAPRTGHRRGTRALDPGTVDAATAHVPNVPPVMTRGAPGVPLARPPPPVAAEL